MSILFQETKFIITASTLIWQLILAAALILTTMVFVYRRKKVTRVLTECNDTVADLKRTILVVYATLTGQSKEIALTFFHELSASSFHAACAIKLMRIDEFAMLDLTNYTEKFSLIIFFLPTYSDGLSSPDAGDFFKQLSDAVVDFRVSKGILSKLTYSIFGLGDHSYGKNYNKAARNLKRHLRNLGAIPLIPIFLCDVSKDVDKQFKSWKKQFDSALNFWLNGDDSIKNDETFDSESDGEEILEDLEELKGVNNKNGTLNKEMITPIIRKSLTKQGYKLIGTHSAVKLCRWTKSMLRGRGGCYKHTFYGIASHRCMEVTPNVACANKCVFCWRHNTNPVGTEWQWSMDDAEFIFENALRLHRQMIKEFKGVPGVVTERFEEGMNPKHCALSLVGEPIMYPRINEFIDFLHAEKISTFMVTNCQFPDAIKYLKTVTQLYVSVDAASKESLKKIDRPLFSDFWERFKESLHHVSEKKYRTVYRLTLVKDYNLEDVDGYVELIKLGNPDFIEIKGVTYCGESSRLTMDNVPWHEEVLKFSIVITDLLPEYEIASEHEHSNCVLIAHKMYKINNVWHTWIDYNKFHHLIAINDDVTSLDYAAITPEWAVYGSDNRGFDPSDVRFSRKKL